ncbi:uncharacterized protein LOC109800686 isoform X1 [Cajanus cajan]|uniref:uncharacterized protein LOC109800686 isoform X1 n=1 Tax=Cajanus cajan TaxID=3821 RepID=UPI0010FBADF5|nr:uncharacterized protein LOC109800686 isoform X1 [Cajanus cajan]
MAASALSLTSPFHLRKPHNGISPSNAHPLIQRGKLSLKPNFFSTLHASPYFRHPFPIAPFSPTQTRASSDEGFDPADEAERFLLSEEKPVKFALWVLLWASLSLAWFAVSRDANAAVDSIKASGFGLNIANSLRKLGWPDGVVVFTLATLPVLELRGAIPVGYWMQLNPTTLTLLSILGKKTQFLRLVHQETIDNTNSRSPTPSSNGWNMVPVPFIVLYLKRFASFLASRSSSASRILDMLFENAKEKAGPVEEFQWLGLMLFVAVPFPGTGAWTGAFIASILDMPFWEAVSANFFGVVFAGLLVNLLVNLGMKYAIITGVILFIVSTFMWSILRNLRKGLSSSN